jgi:SagB-type dehydrogenase family enzyme
MPRSDRPSWAPGKEAATLVAEELKAARRNRPTEASREPVPWRDNTDGTRLKLGDLLNEDSHTLAEVLSRRRSAREWAPPGLSAIATMLVRTLRVIEWGTAPDGYLTTHRPTPSAGARHPFDVYLLAHEVDGLAAGSWRFDALTCELVQSPDDHKPGLETLGEIIGQATPPAALVAVAHIDRTLSRYPDGLSLLWRDAGALLATLHLCATDLDLASCIVGATGAMTYDLARREVDVGSLIVGAQPTPSG